MEDYKRKLELAKERYNSTTSKEEKEFIESLFPELKENEDEKIRKDIVAAVETYGDFTQCRKEEIYAWLEKQNSNVDNANKEYWRGYREGKQEILDKYAELEKQDEQTPTDEVNPKFKVGDWVIVQGKTLYQIKQVTELSHNHYQYWTTDEHWFGDGTEARLWTIQDAKDGDVLAEHETIVLFNTIEGQNIRCYCTYHYLGFNPTIYVGTLQNKNPYCPATKEQCDLLEQKMKETGYEWDAKKKELKVIEKQGEQKPIIIIPQFKVGDIIKPKPYNEEHLIKDINENGYVLDVDIIIPFKDEDIWEIVKQKSSWNEDDEQNLNFWLDNNKSIDSDKRNWLKSLKDRIQPQPKQKWSEEDKEMLNRLIGVLEGTNNEDYHEAWELKFLPWLKSLKPQPKQEWSEEDETNMDYSSEIIGFLKNYIKTYGCTATNNWVNWLKNIKDRVQPQSKQEWDEEDCNFIKELCGLLASISKDGYVGKYYTVDLVEKLKSLKPQNHWKPSKEQMEALNAINNIGELSYVEQSDLLVKLYNDLKKL